MRLSFRWVYLYVVGALVLLLNACAHPISIVPTSTPQKSGVQVVKRVGYVITDQNKNKQVTTPGGGGDNITYYPYKDLEKSIRDALKSVYVEVVALTSTNDEVAKSNKLNLIFVPEITTTSKSESMLTWPPTHFYINLTCSVLGEDEKLVDTFIVSSDGYAEFSEFKQDFGLAGRRAANQLAERLRNSISSNDKLK